MKFVSKPVEVEAIQWRGNNLNDILEINAGVCRIEQDKNMLIIRTPYNTTSLIMRGDWFFKSVNGEINVLAEELFNKYYELVV